MSDIGDILDRAADLIEPEGAWTRGGTRTATGNITWSQDPLAVCHCAINAISRVSGRFDDPASRGARDALRSVIGRHWIGEWNDAPERTQAEVVAKLREAASLSRNQEQGK